MNCCKSCASLSFFQNKKIDAWNRNFGSRSLSDLENETMRRYFVMTILVCFSTLVQTVACAQDGRLIPEINDPHKNKIIPDKVFEIGLPVLLIFFLMSTMVSIFKSRSESRLKEKAIEKGISEPALIQLFSEHGQLEKTVYLKWCLVLAALAVAFLSIHLISTSAVKLSPYLPLGIIFLALSIAFIIYYRILQKK